MRICLLSYRSNPHCGGQGVYLKNLSRALRDLGHHVEVATGPPDPGLDPDIPVFPLFGLDLYNPENLFRMPSLKELADPVNLAEWVGVSTMGFPEPYTFGLRALKWLRGRFDRYDIVHDNQSLSYGIRQIGRRIPTVATIHHPVTRDRKIAVRSASSFLTQLRYLRWYSFIGMQKRVSRSLARILTVSGCAARDIGLDYGVPSERFRVVPNGIDTTLFHPIAGIRREENRILATNSADMPLKGLSHLLRAVARISENRRVRLFVVGELKKNGETDRLIRDLGIGGSVTFTGRLPHGEFVEQYARASVAVIPSLYEGFGLPAGEAMACGIPVVSTTGGALPEVVGDAGLLVPPGDSQALAQAVEAVMDQPGLAERLGRAGFQRVHAHFTWKRAAEMTVEVYQEAMDDHRRFQTHLRC